MSIKVGVTFEELKGTGHVVLAFETEPENPTEIEIQAAAQLMSVLDKMSKGKLTEAIKKQLENKGSES